MLTKFGKEMRKLRIDAHMTIAKMAEKIDMCAATISLIERGNHNINPKVLNKILSVFDLPESRKEHLKRLAYESNKSITIDLSNSHDKSKELVATFATRFEALNEDDIRQIMEILREY